MRHLLRIADLDSNDLRALLRTAAAVKRQPRRWRHVLADDTVVLAFANPSTRTRLAFHTATAHLGGQAITTGPDELQLGRGETIEDTARVISHYARALVIRTPDHTHLERFAAAATIPVINALTNQHHPTQALADLLTLHEHYGHLAGLRLAYLGAGNNVAHSLLEACALTGIDITLATPPGYQPDPTIVAAAETVAQRHGSLITTTLDPLAAAADADVVYTDTWHSLNDPDTEHDARTAALEPYRVDPAVMAAAAPHAVFLHCLPAHRGQEVTTNVIDGPQSLVLAQAANRLATAQGLLLALTEHPHPLTAGDGAGRCTPSTAPVVAR